MGFFSDLKDRIGSIFGGKDEVVETVKTTPKTITGPKETGGVITGTTKDIITPSVEIPKTKVITTTSGGRSNRRTTRTTYETGKPVTKTIESPTKTQLLEQRVPTEITPKPKVSQAADDFGIPIKQTASGYIEPIKPVQPPETQITLPPTPSRQLELPTTSQLLQRDFGTRTDLGERFDYEIQTSPYITQKQIGEFRGVPTYETVYIDPSGLGTQKERLATQEESNFYEQQKKQSQFDEVMKSGVFPNTLEGREAARRYIREITRKTERKAKTGEFKATVKENAKEFQKEIIPEEKQTIIKSAIEYSLEKNPVTGLIPEKERKVASSAITEFITPTSGELITGVATLGTGAIVGAGIRAGEKGVGFTVGKIAPLITKDVKKVSKAVKVTSGAYKGLTTIGGNALGGAYVVNVGKQVKEAQTPEEKGEIIGGSAREALLFGVGYSKGQKLTGKGIQLFKTRGMERIEPPVRESVLKGDEPFPGLPKNQRKLSQKQVAKIQKDIFEKGKYVEYFKEPNKPSPGLHMAPQKLSVTEVNRPLHISPEASIHFLGLGRKGAPKSYLKGFFEPTPEPIGYSIIPKKYKTIKGREVKRGEYIFKGKTEPGVAYITGEKPGEIQAVLTEGTKLLPTKKGAYFVYEGYRIPIKGYETFTGKKITPKQGKRLTEYEKLIRKATSEIPSYPKFSFRAIPSYKIRKSSIPKSNVKTSKRIYTSKSLKKSGLSRYPLPSASGYLGSFYEPSRPTSKKYSGKTSYKPSRPTSKKYSGKTSYKPSIPTSYKPSIPTSKKYSGKTSYKPSRPTSYQSSRPTSYKPSRPLISKIPKKRTLKPTKKSGKMVKKGKRFEGSYRRYGKWITFPKGNKAKVTANVKRKVKRELGASYKIKDLKKGKYIMPQITKQFRRSKSKKTPYVVVEKRKYRLDSPKEKREIKSARKSKKNMFFK